MKLVVVGGGSTYTPELVDGIARLADTLPVRELVLVDPDEHRLDRVGGVSARIMAAYGHPATVLATTDLDDGLDGAAAVLLPLRIGGQAARHRDETWPLSCGVTDRVHTEAPAAQVAVVDVPPIAGAALLGLDHLGIGKTEQDRLRAAYATAGTDLQATG